MRRGLGGLTVMSAALGLLAGLGLVPAGPASAAAGSPAHPAVRASGAASTRWSPPAGAPGYRLPAGGTAAARPAGEPASAPVIPVGSGPVRNGTLLSFAVSDKVSLQVNAGSGDALVTSDITLPEVGTSLTLGLAYNSLLLGSGVADGSDGPGWRQREGVDVQLIPASDGSVTFLGEDGTAGKFTPVTGGYTSPPQFHVTLANSPGSTCGGTGYTMTWHQSGEVMCFTTGGLLTSETDRNGNTSAFSCNGSGQETKITYTPHGDSAATQTVTVGYAGPWVADLSQTSGSLGTREAVYGGNESTGLLTSDTQPDNTEVQFGYDSADDLTSIENGDDGTTTLTYNSAHQVTSVTQPTTGTGTATTRLSYVSATETQVAAPDTSQSSPVSSVPNTTYTITASSALVTKVVDPGGNTRSATYTPLDDVATATNGLTGKTANTYGANSGESLTSSASPTGATSSLAYGNSDTGTNPTASFQSSSARDAQGNATAYTYDGPGNLAQSTDALAATAKVTYNSDGTPATSTDPTGGQTTYGYTDGNHEVNKITPPAGSALKPETITYDPAGRVSTVTGGDGNTLTYSYDIMDRVQSAAYAGGPHPVTVTYAYDGDGNLTQAKDGGGTTSYTYNSQNQLTALTDPAGNLWQFGYNAAGQRTETWFATNTGNTSYAVRIGTAYDVAGRVTRIEAWEPGDNVISDVAWCYSPYTNGSCPGNTPATDTSLVQYAENLNTSAYSRLTYDTGNRLKTAANYNFSGKNYSYGYDADGNLTTGAAAGTLAYNQANQVTTSGYAYDGAGNQVASPYDATITYNDAGQMTSASTQNEQFTYAGTGQDQVLSDGSATGITYGLAARGGQPWVQSYTPAGTSTPVYVLHDQQGTPLGIVTGGKTDALVPDNLGSVTAMITSAGATAATWTYDPYGNIITTTGTGTASLIGYTGALTDPGTGGTYTHLGNRWYHPTTGSFTTQDTSTYLNDPANGNRYAYAGDNPTNNIDPTGNSWWSGLFTALAFEVAVSVTCSALVVGFTGGLGAGAIVGCFFLGGVVAYWAGSEGGKG